MDTITVSTHEDFMSDFDEATVELYKKYVQKNLAELGHSDVVFDDNQRTHSIIAPISRSSDEYRDIEDALEAAWTHAVN